MRKCYRWEWEKLDEVSRRVKVVGGWIVQSEAMSPKGQCAISAVFIPDSEHQWGILPPPKAEEPEIPY